MEGGHRPPFFCPEFVDKIRTEDQGNGTMNNRPDKAQAGFTLIELMIVVAIIGILASVAISSYQTYTIRAQVTEGLSMASMAKTPITDSFLETGEAPHGRRSLAGCHRFGRFGFDSRGCCSVAGGAGTRAHS